MTHYAWTDRPASTRLEDLERRLSDNTVAVEHVFTQTFLPEAKAAAQNLPKSDLAGALVSAKDLLDVEGHVTRAGTTFMQNDAPAARDADAIANLRAAGAVIVGHTNMTELAYSGLGLNAHYGTPRNALNPQAIPGGSTSGGAVSVAQGLVDIAIGSDTGGSLRIPAAFNGIVGFKPTQSTVSRVGVKALSRSLDSIGPIARSVAACRLAYEVMRVDTRARGAVAPEFVIPENFGFDEIDPAIQAGFDQAARSIEAVGYRVTRAAFDVLERYKALQVWHFSAVECRGEYEEAYQTLSETFDPRVASRMARADEVSAVAYRQTLNMREALIAEFTAEIGDRCLLMPTTPIAPPLFSAMEDDAEYGRVNLLALRNPSLANVIGGCSISLPWLKGDVPVGVMLTAAGGRDAGLLDLAASIEGVLE